MFQFMFMVQLLVKFRFFIQELWERKSLQILYEWTNVDDGRIMRSWRSCLLLYHLLRKPYFSWIITCYYLLIHLYSYRSSCWYIWIFIEKNYHFILELNINSCLSLIEKTLFHLITIFISFRVLNDPIFSRFCYISYISSPNPIFFHNFEKKSWIFFWEKISYKHDK
jgi:hypothetical protein